MPVEEEAVCVYMCVSAELCVTVQLFPVSKNFFL